MVPVFYRPEVTTAQLFERDRFVFQTRSIGAVLELYDNTMRACVEAHGEG